MSPFFLFSIFCVWSFFFFFLFSVFCVATVYICKKGQFCLAVFQLKKTSLEWIFSTMGYTLFEVIHTSFPWFYKIFNLWYIFQYSEGNEIIILLMKLKIWMHIRNFLIQMGLVSDLSLATWPQADFFKRIFPLTQLSHFQDIAIFMAKLAQEMGSLISNINYPGW